MLFADLNLGRAFCENKLVPFALQASGLSRRRLLTPLCDLLNDTSPHIQPKMTIASKR